MGNLVPNSSGEKLLGTKTTRWNSMSLSDSIDTKYINNRKLNNLGTTEPNYLYGIDYNRPYYAPIYIFTKIFNNVIKKVTCANRNSSILFIDENNYLYSFGEVTNGVLGNGTTNQYNSTPTKISETKWKTIYSNGYNIVFAIDENDYLYAWGNNDFGQLGTGLTNGATQFTPYLISSTTKWSKVFADYLQSTLIDSDGYLYSCGSNMYGQLGTGTNNIQYTPFKIGNSKWNDAKLGNSWSYLLDENNYLYAMGCSYYVGTYMNVQNQCTPLQIGTSKWKQTSLTAQAGITEDGYLYRWGKTIYYPGNSNNQTISSYTPIQIGTSKWNSIFNVFYNWNIALDENNQLYSWGNNDYGQLGLGIFSKNAQYTPFLVSTTKWKDIKLGSYAVCGLSDDLYLYSWGNITLGDGKTNNEYQYTPYKMSTRQLSQIYTNEYIATRLAILY